MSTIVQWMAKKALACYPFARGQGRIIDRTPLARMRFKERTMWVRTSDGFPIQVFPNDHIGRHIFLTGEFDRTIPEVLIHLSRPGDRILDVGANVGYVSCVLLSKIEGSRVVSVEPQPEVFRVLDDNVHAVGESRAVALNCAVSDRSGVGRLAIAEGNTGASRLVSDTANQGSAADPAEVSVNIVTGRELFRESGLDKLDLIKVDVEGHEYEVLSSMASVLAETRPRAIVFEHLTPLEGQDAPVRPLLEGLGYEISAIQKSLTRWRLVPLSEIPPGTHWAHDYVARPRSEAA